MMVVKLSRQKLLLVLTVSVTMVLIIFQKPSTKKNLLTTNAESPMKWTGEDEEEETIEEGRRLPLSATEIGNFSKLGRILFLDEKPPNVVDVAVKRYKILVWKYGKTIETRHLKMSLSENINPFVHCSVSNCGITYKDSDLQLADLVIFHLHRTKGLHDLPLAIKRNPQQIWAFSTDESPYHTFLHGENKLTDFDGLFNWSMTYRMDSDIPVPYGRTIHIDEPDIQYENLMQDKRRDVLIAIMGSNCGGVNHRWKYIKELQRHVSVDVYGHCGPLKCPGHFYKDCPLLSKYIFYLAFENSNCDQYITEKLWWNAYEKYAIPVVMGATKDSYGKLAPPGSYINIEDYAKPRDLAQYLLYLNSTGEFMRYHEWRRWFRVLNEHGYFGTDSFHYCRACEALNYNERSVKVYKKLAEYWSVKRDCRAAWDN